MGLKSHSLKLSLNCLHCISIIYCGNENGCIEFLFPLISLPWWFSTNEHQVNPNLNKKNLQDWIRNMQMKIKGRRLLFLTALMNLLPLTFMLRDQLFPTSFSFLYILARLQFMHTCSFSWLISLMGNAGLNNVISLSVSVKCPKVQKTFKQAR